jgi:hypothetical protein
MDYQNELLRRDVKRSREERMKMYREQQQKEGALNMHEYQHTRIQNGSNLDSVSYNASIRPPT